MRHDITELSNHIGQIWGLSWSPDGSHLCSACADGEVRLWAIDDLSYSILNPRINFDSIKNDDQIKHMAFSVSWSSLDDLIAVSFGSCLRVWSAVKRTLVEEVKAPSSTNLSWSPIAQILAMTPIDSFEGGYPRYKVELVEVQSFRSQGKLKETFSEINDMAWSPDGKVIAIATGYGIALSDATFLLEPAGYIPVRPRPDAIVWLSDEIVAAGCFDANIRVYSWKWVSGLQGKIASEQIRVLEGHQSHVLQLSHSPKQFLLATLDYLGEIHLWRSDTFDHITAITDVIDRERETSSLRIALHPRQPIIAVSCANRIWLVKMRLPDTSATIFTSAETNQREAETLSKVLARAGLLSEQKVNSDQIGERWSLVEQTDSQFSFTSRSDASDPLAKTLTLRKIAQQVSEFDSLAREGMQLAWGLPEHYEEIEIEKLELATYKDAQEERAYSRRGLSRLLLCTISESKTEKKRLPALVAYVTLAHGSRREIEEAFGETSGFWQQADKQDKEMRRLARRIQSLYSRKEYKDLSENMASVLTTSRGAMERAKQLQGDLKVTDEPLALIMKGAGIKGLAYVGALGELMKYYNFNWFVGTSAGAITAVLLAAGYTVEELEELLRKKDFKDFFDAGFLRGVINLFFHQGFYRAGTFTKWLDDLLAAKLKSVERVKLKSLPDRATVYACRRDQNALIFDSHDPQSCERSAAFAARCSMAIPFVFTPEKEEGLNVFDGGAKHNYPVEVVLAANPNTRFIGLYVGPKIYEGHAKPYGVFGDLKNIAFEATDVEALRKHKEHTVIIDTRPISTLDFELTDIEKEFLLKEGRSAALDFLFRQNIFGVSEEQAREATTEAAELKRIVIKSRTRRSRMKKIIIAGSVLLLAMLVFLFVRAL